MVLGKFIDTKWSPGNLIILFTNFCAILDQIIASTLSVINWTELSLIKQIDNFCAASLVYKCFSQRKAEIGHKVNKNSTWYLHNYCNATSYNFSFLRKSLFLKVEIKTIYEDKQENLSSKNLGPINLTPDALIDLFGKQIWTPKWTMKH